MKLPELLPPNDLLKQIEGVESGLRRRRYLGNIGAAGTLIAVALQAGVTVANSAWWKDLSEFHFSQLVHEWPYLLGLVAAAFFAALFAWSRFWLKESREAFRYTCSIADFEPVRSKPEDPAWLTPELRERLCCLSHDLAERFSQRVSRVRFRDKPAEAKPGESVSNQSHIHIRGVFVLRRDRQDHWVLEIMPRVRIGPVEASESLAHPVSYRLEQPVIDRNHYERIQERLYFSVATELYRQIQEDVARKIELLPTAYFRAIAYFYEAEDYSRSNTLDAYKEASKLYGKAIELFDPRLKPLPETPLLKWIEQKRRVLSRQRARAAWSCSFLRPMLARTQLMCARAEIGYANMLLYRRILAGMSGQRLNPIYEARPIALDAVDRLQKLHPDVPGRRESLFDACVTVSLAKSRLGDVKEPAEWLDRARRLDPARSEEDPRFLFVCGSIQNHLTSRMNLLRRAIELEPRFEVARWSLAITRETLWRTRPSLEPNVALLVLEEYEEVLKINPGNVSAWANRGYIRWLLADKDPDAGLKRAREEFENGLEYKAMRPQTFISELDYGLARISAEQGDIVTAYKHYVDAVSALLAEGVFHGAEDSTYYFNQIGSEMLERIDRYRQCVRSATRVSGDADPAARVKRSVGAYALNDYGEACYIYFLRRGDKKWLNRARALFRLAARLNPQYAVPCYQLANAARQKSILENTDAIKGHLLREALRRITRATDLEPDWADGALKRASIYADWARQAPGRRQAAEKAISAIEEEAKKLREKAREKSAEARRVEKAEAQFSEARTAPSGRPLDAGAPPPQPAPAGATPVDIRAQAVPIESKLPEAQQSAAPPPVRLDPATGIEAVLLDKEAASLNTQAASAEEKAAAMRDSEKKLQAVEEKQQKEFAQAVRNAERLLPHAWLFSKPPGPDGPVFDWNVLNNREYVQEWKWEREFTDLHAKALRARALTASALPGNSPADLQRKLIPFLREHFFPGDFDLMEAGREPAPDSATPGFTEEMRAVICAWVSENPADYWALSWVIDPSFFEDGRYDDLAEQILSKALDQLNLSAHTCLWIGEQCQAKMPQIARRAFQRVPEITPDTGLLARAGYRQEQLAEWEGARETYQRAVAILEALAASPALAVSARAATRARRVADDCRISLGKILWRDGNYAGAIAQFDCIKRETPWIRGVVRNILAAPDIGSHRLMKSWLERKAMACRRSGAEQTRKDVNEAILSFADTEPGAPLPVVTPVAVEAEASLFPEGEEWAKTHPLFTGYLPQMRQRIEIDMGVKVPGIRFRAEQTELPRDTYRILLNEVPLVSGQVVRGCKFCPDESILGQSGKPAFNPKTPWHDGAWLGEKDWAAAGTAGLPLWDHFQYIIAHVETMLRANLAEFLGLQEVENMLDAWPNQAADILPDFPCRFRFTRLLQALVTENVPVTDLAAILDAVRNTPAGPGAELLPWLEAARLKLRDRLPGNHADAEFFWLSPRFEAAIRESVERLDGSGDPLRAKTLFSLLPETAQDLLKAVRDSVGGTSRRQVLVARADGIRPFVRRLIQPEFPHVQTLSLAELRPNLRETVRSMIEL